MVQMFFIAIMVCRVLFRCQRFAVSCVLHVFFCCLFACLLVLLVAIGWLGGWVGGVRFC